MGNDVTTIGQTLLKVLSIINERLAAVEKKWNTIYENVCGNEESEYM